jgi:RNA polymerase sigma factor (sigma-70 family)
MTGRTPPAPTTRTSVSEDARGSHLWNPAPLRRWVRRLGRSSTDCDDIVQEAYLRLLESSGRGRKVGSQLGYLLVIARNLVTDAGRQDTLDRKRVRALQVLGTQLNANEPSAEELAFVAQAQEQLGKAMRTLPPRVRRVFLLHRFRALSHKEIARRLGITTRTVERDIASALALLKAALFPGNCP